MLRHELASGGADRSARRKQAASQCARNCSASFLVLIRAPGLDSGAIAPRVGSTENTERVFRCLWSPRADRAPGHCGAGGASLAGRIPPAAFASYSSLDRIRPTIETPAELRQGCRKQLTIKLAS